MCIGNAVGAARIARHFDASDDGAAAQSGAVIFCLSCDLHCARERLAGAPGERRSFRETGGQSATLKAVQQPEETVLGSGEGESR